MNALDTQTDLDWLGATPLPADWPGIPSGRWVKSPPVSRYNEWERCETADLKVVARIRPPRLLQNISVFQGVAAATTSYSRRSRKEHPGKTSKTHPVTTSVTTPLSGGCRGSVLKVARVKRVWRCVDDDSDVWVASLPLHGMSCAINT